MSLTNKDGQQWAISRLLRDSVTMSQINSSSSLEYTYFVSVALKYGVCGRGGVGSTKKGLCVKGKNIAL